MRERKSTPSGHRDDVIKNVSLELTPELAIDLHAFCEAHYDSPKQSVIREALRQFIEGELKSSGPGPRTRFQEAKRRLEKGNVTQIRVVGSDRKSGRGVDSDQH